MTDVDILNEMISERHDLRIEIIEMEKSMHKAVFLLVTLALTLFGLQSGKFQMPLGIPLDHVFIAVTQIECFIIIFVLSLVANQNVHAGYIMALERKINDLAGKNIALWETEACSEHLFHLRGSFSWVVGTLGLMLFSFYAYGLYKAITLVDTFVFGMVITLEVVLIAGLALFTLVDKKRVYSRVCSQLG